MESLTVFGVAALLVRIGFAVYIAGISRSKNSATAVMRSLAEFCCSALAFAAIGAALLWQTRNAVFGLRMDFLLGGTSDAPALFFQTAAILTATPAMLGATAERSKLKPVLLASVLLSALVLPIAGNWVWYGWLRRMGCVDVAGALALQLPAGVCALVAAATIGPRAGKYNRDGSTSMIPGHSAPFAAVGLMIVIIGWIAYVVGSAAIRVEPVIEGAAAEVLLAVVAAGGAAMVYSHLRYGKLDLLLSLTGMLGGLVAISAGAGQFGTRTAIIVGAGAGVLVPWCAVALDLLLRIDDPSNLIAAQIAGGVWGGLAAGGLVADASGMERLRALGVQAVAIVAIAALALGFSAGLFYAMKAIIGLRSKEADEYDGLDLAELDVGAYPDFQQNMIRSYHLREA